MCLECNVNNALNSPFQNIFTFTAAPIDCTNQISTLAGATTAIVIPFLDGGNDLTLNYLDLFIET